MENYEHILAAFHFGSIKDILMKVEHGWLLIGYMEGKTCVKDVSNIRFTDRDLGIHFEICQETLKI